MAISPLPNTLKSLTFDGKTSASFGVAILGEGAFNAPQRAVEMINIPGRNGAYALDQGRFENITVTYPANLIAESTEDFAEGISAFRNFLCSRKGYVRLSDDYNPGEYRLAVYKSGLEVDESVLRAGEFKLSFDCKPQRFLVSGETPQSASDWSDVETETGDIVTIEADEKTGLKDLTADIEPIQDLHGYNAPWVGGAGKNKVPNITSQIAGSGITATWQTDGTLKLTGTASGNVFVGIQFSIVAGSYVLSGCPSGGGDSTYQLDIRSSVGSGVLYSRDIGSGLSFSPSADLTAYVNIRIANGYACPSGGLIIKPMIRKSTDSATYEPYENICPISGHTDVVVSRTGKNLLDTSTAEIGTAWNGASNSARARLVIPLVVGQTYTLKANGTSTLDSWYGIETDTIPPSSAGAVLSNPYTFTATTKYLSLGFNKTAIASSDIEALKLQLEYGSSASTYEPYQGDTYTTDLDGTRYGGTLDVTSGVLTVTHAYTTIGSLNWTYGAIDATHPYGYFYTTNLNGKKSGVTNVKSSAYETYGSGFGADGKIFGHGSNYIVYIVDSAYTDASAFKTARSTQQIVYELATPTTVQLTAEEIDLLLGQNNIWASSGDVTVEYGEPPFTNPTMFPSNPLIKVTGIGTLTVGDTSIVITGTASQVVYIDCESKEIYKIIGGVITPAGSLVSFSTPDFPQLKPGINKVVKGTGITDVEITPRWWRI